MKHTGYTPGPWLIVGHGGDKTRRSHSLILEDGSEDGVLVASVLNVKPTDLALIAAAPRLAEENERLRALLAAAEPMLDNATEKLRADIRAALAGRNAKG